MGEVILLFRVVEGAEQAHGEPLLNAAVVGLYGGEFAQRIEQRVPAGEVILLFRVGFREINVSNWITRMQFREYTLHATGWVRFVTGLQSLISVALLALWLVTYFGRPFK